MQTWTPSWRGSPFVGGQAYRVVSVPIAAFPRSKPPINSVLAYRQSGYSRYDSCSIYEFVSAAGETFEWWLGDDEPLESWRQVFEATTSAG